MMSGVVFFRKPTDEELKSKKWGPLLGSHNGKKGFLKRVNLNDAVIKHGQIHVNVMWYGSADEYYEPIDDIINPHIFKALRAKLRRESEIRIKKNVERDMWTDNNSM